MKNRYKQASQEERDYTILRLKEYFENYKEIIFAYVHGSYADGLPFRDIDIAIFVDDTVIRRNMVLDYELNISTRAEMKTGIKPLDVKIINYTPIGFKFYATKGILLFSRDEDVRCDFLEMTWKRYFDLLPGRKQILLDLVS
ncbi:MAG: nucleotidyltransferase domain-containing protein [Nitrospirae bacterium]|nr:nucleotidyltransferase domain-containing protein [Nitrospirota bacterium]